MFLLSSSSRSQRVLWLLEELGLAYEVKYYQRDPRTLFAPRELRAIHPLGKSPVITEDGVTLAESGAIVEYLIERHGGGRLIPPAGSQERTRYRYWMHFAEGSAMPPLLMKLVFDRIERAPMPFFARPIARAIANRARTSFIEPQLRTQLDFMENELGKKIIEIDARPSGKNVRRLTSDTGAEILPVFAPDGKTLAFTAEYDGNYDVYTIPVKGGSPTRLTWHPGSDIVRLPSAFPFPKKYTYLRALGLEALDFELDLRFAIG